MSTEGNLRIPLTYDDFPSHLNPALLARERPERHKMTLKELGQPLMNKDELRWTKHEL